MNRRTSLITAGFLTAAIATAIVTMSNFASGAPAQTAVTAAPQGAVITEEAAATAYLQEVQTTLAEREAALASQLATATQAITDLDASAQAQIAAAQAQVTQVEGAAATPKPPNCRRGRRTSPNCRVRSPTTAPCFSSRWRRSRPMTPS
jgi:hypothetical protein